MSSFKQVENGRGGQVGEGYRHALVTHFLLEPRIAPTGLHLEVLEDEPDDRVVVEGLDDALGYMQ